MTGSPYLGTTAMLCIMSVLGNLSELGRDDGLFSSIIIFAEQFLKVISWHSPVLAIHFEEKRHRM